MTEEEKNTVRSLREQGYGYKTISNITGIHRETIKSHLKRHPCEIGSAPPRPSQCQIKMKTETKKVEAPQGAEIVPCKQCGEPFIPKRKGTLFCCDECRHKWWGKNKYKEGTPHTFKCLNCGKEFQANVVKDRKYCSHDCYIEARFGKKPAREKDNRPQPVRDEVTPSIENSRQELDFRLSKWILKNVEQLLTPDEVEIIWAELLSYYSPPTASIENVSGSTSNPLGHYQRPEGGDFVG